MLTINISGNEVKGTAQEIAQLLQLVETATTTSVETVKAEKQRKAQPKAKREHAAVLDTKRVENMTARAIATAIKAGFEVNATKQGSWVWLYPRGKSSGQGRTEEFKALKLAKGWKYSPKRGAFYRDFTAA